MTHAHPETDRGITNVEVGKKSDMRAEHVPTPRSLAAAAPLSFSAAG